MNWRSLFNSIALTALIVMMAHWAWEHKTQLVSAAQKLDSEFTEQRGVVKSKATGSSYISGRYVIIGTGLSGDESKALVQRLRGKNLKAERIEKEGEYTVRIYAQSKLIAKQIMEKL